MQLGSSAFSEGELIPDKYTCDGEGISPDLEISEVPAGSKSLVLIMDDPDAPMGNFNHWVVWNIDPQVSKIEEGGMPAGAISGVNDNEIDGYTGPCPPGGVHRYYFKLYALDIKLDLGLSSRKEDVEEAMVGHIIDQAELMGRYSRI